MKIGGIYKNEYAGDKNPSKYGYYIGNYQFMSFDGNLPYIAKFKKDCKDFMTLVKEPEEYYDLIRTLRAIHSNLNKGYQEVIKQDNKKI